MKVCYVYDGDWPQGATRVVKQTRALAAAGHEVVCITRNSNAEPETVHEPWMEVRRLPIISATALRKPLNFPFFGNPIWIHHLSSVIADFRPDLLIVADLPLAPLVVRQGHRHGIPVHYDMAEIYPEFLRSLLMFERMGPIKRAIRNPALADAAERYVLPRVAMTYVVSEESALRLEMLGVPRSRICQVGNTPEHLPDLTGEREAPSEVFDAVAAGRPILLFVGILIGDRGVMHAVNAMPTLLRSHPDALLVIVGDGPERVLLEERVGALGLGASVRILGWREHSDLPRYYAHASLGLIPFRDSPHVRLTLANKLFDYMSAALPVLAADLPSTRRIVEQTRCGELFTPDSPEALAEAAARLLTDDQLTTLGHNGRRAIETEYNWQHDATRFLAAVATAVPAAGRPRRSAVPSASLDDR
jgi:glycosyltransferase involved in cell wall biosynthesis